MTKKKGHSIFSVLSTLLVISKWSLILILITVPLTAIGAPFFPLQFGSDPADLDAKWPTFFVGVKLDEEMTHAAFLLESFVITIFTGVGLYVVLHLQKILKNAQIGAAFSRENGRRLREIGYAGAGAQLFVYGLWFFSVLADGFGIADFEGRTITLTPAPWIGILGAFALSTIFMEGADMKEEQDLTV